MPDISGMPDITTGRRHAAEGARACFATVAAEGGFFGLNGLQFLRRGPKSDVCLAMRAHDSKPR
jgi:hypothetical protein